jgi:hypothetical protein
MNPLDAPRGDKASGMIGVILQVVRRAEDYAKDPYQTVRVVLPPALFKELNGEHHALGIQVVEGIPDQIRFERQLRNRHTIRTLIRTGVRLRHGGFFWIVEGFSNNLKETVTLNLKRIGSTGKCQLTVGWDDVVGVAKDNSILLRPAREPAREPSR